MKDDEQIMITKNTKKNQISNSKIIQKFKWHTSNLKIAFDNSQIKVVGKNCL